MIGQTYVHGDTEVVLTGRVAKRTLASRRGNEPKIDVKLEIKPKSDLDGSWTKFVYEKDLYEVHDKDDNADS